MDALLKKNCKAVLNGKNGMISKNDYKNAIKHLRLHSNINAINDFSHSNICKLIYMSIKKDLADNVLSTISSPPNKFKQIYNSRSGKKIALLCAQYITNKDEDISTSDQNKLKQFMKHEGISFNESDKPRLLCQKLLEKLKPEKMMPLMPFANKLIFEEIKRQDDIEMQLELEHKALQKKRKIFKIQNQSIDTNDLKCSNRIFNNNTYRTIIDDTLGHNAHIGIPLMLYEPLINLAIDEEISAPLVEITTSNDKKMYVRIQQRDPPEGIIYISPLIAATLAGNHDDMVKCKVCTNIKEATKFFFIMITDNDDNEVNDNNVNDVNAVNDVKSNKIVVNEALKGKVQQSLQRYLERFAGITIGMKVPVLLDNKLVTFIIEKILDNSNPPNSIPVAQAATTSQIDFDIRSINDAFDQDGDLIPISNVNGVNDGNFGNDDNGGNDGNVVNGGGRNGYMNGDESSLVFGMNY